MKDQLTIVECPRDAMQGIDAFIPTSDKIKLLNALIEVGFPVVDFGSFVSPKAIPQMADSSEVLREINPSNSKLLAIIANKKGAIKAVNKEKVSILGYPLSVSETFQQRNSNKSIIESLEELNEIIELCNEFNKELVVYLSMAFGNPYGEAYSQELVEQFAGILISLGVKTIAISDTIGLASPSDVSSLFKLLSLSNPSVEWGLHLHARPEITKEKVKSALAAGCRRLDGAILGLGGCPMAKDDLVGNINTRTILEIADELELNHGLDIHKFNEAEKVASKVFKLA